MYGRMSPAVVALLAGMALLAAGCSSTSSPAPSAASGSAAPSTSSAGATPFESSPAPAGTPSPSAGALTAADCKVIKPISSSVIGTLTPLQSEPKAKANAALKSYVAQLQTAESHVTSTAGKADLGALASALQKSETAGASATSQIVAAIGKLSSLSSAC
jgi:hypothetical protein